MPDDAVIVIAAADLVGETAWERAGPDKRRALLAYAAGLARQLKLDELRAGVDVDGTPLAPVKKSSRPDGATGPPLSPHDAESRTQKWLSSDYDPEEGTIVLFWRNEWGEVLRDHAAGIPGAPPRDVLGLTDDSWGRLRNLTRWWWSLH